jgi:exodeoxyribonuclease V beta subunit
MNKSSNKIKFNANQIELSGSNLIEASAGTGKTYSITLLVLRLLVQKETDIRKILMVTFTKAAVAELDERIRTMVRNSYDYLTLNTNIDDNLKTIIDAAAETNRVKCLQLLKVALLQLDELSIFTIHSFAQQMLVEFAFETGQLFGVEMLSDESEILERSSNRYWRENIAPLPFELLDILTKNQLSRSNYMDIVKRGSGSFNWVCDDTYTLANTEEEYQNATKVCDELLDKFTFHLETNKEDIHSRIETHTNARNAFSHLLDEPEELILAIALKAKIQYVEKLLPLELEIAIEYTQALAIASNIAVECNYYLYGEAINFVKKEIVSIKTKDLLVSFDDLINKLHSALKTSKSLASQIGEKFEAVFIDEFQDTDQTQYEIFAKIFGHRHPMFFIGDPKQSIYTWRGADLETYKAAAAKVDKRFTMGTNYRSTAKFIEDCNTFFASDKNAFYDEDVSYDRVSAKAQKSDNLFLNGVISEGIEVFSATKNDEIISQTVLAVADLISSEYRIGNARVEASDITILVRGKKQGVEIKNELTNHGIAAVTTDEATILESREARFIYYLLQAIENPKRSSIHRALLGPFTSIKSREIPHINLEHEIARFRQLQDAWKDQGIFESLQKFLQMYAVVSYLLRPENKNGERSLSNIFQMIELLHQVEYRKNFSGDELIHWLKKNIDNPSQENRYLQRIESDKQCVSISTIHSSKGLAFPIVFAPSLNLRPTIIKGKTLTYKNPHTGVRHISLRHTDQEKEWSAYEQEQENRRLIYVALTRSIYKCYVFDNQKLQSTFLHQNLLQLQEQNLFNYGEVPNPKSLSKINLESNIRRENRPFNAAIDNSWGVTSFSKLSGSSHHKIEQNEMHLDDAYDKFVFEDMARGPHLGNFIHDLLEKVQFNKKETWPRTIEIVGSKHGQLYDESQFKYFLALVEHIAEAKIPSLSQFKLSDVLASKKLPEMEFYFNIKDLNPKLIEDNFPNVKLENHRRSEGIMNGFIDLLFEYDNRYYILDWKSNFLGSGIERYDSEQLSNAMTNNNYHLQYLVYTVAVHRYLKVKLPNYSYEEHFGGVLYYFIRAVRANGSTGIFYTKPSLKQIELLDGLL